MKTIKPLKRSLLLLLSAIILILNSCMDCVEGTGPLIDEERNLGEIEVLVLNSMADVVIFQNKLSDNCEAVITAQENVMHLIKTEMNGSKLTIDIDGCLRTEENIEIEIALNKISRIIMDGSGDLSSANIIKFDDLDIIHKGSGEISLRLKGEVLDIDTDGSGDIKLDGSVAELNIEQDGSGDVNAFKLKAESADISNEGSGVVNVDVKRQMKVVLRGSGDVNYSGGANVTDQKIEGSGNLNQVK